MLKLDAPHSIHTLGQVSDRKRMAATELQQQLVYARADQHYHSKWAFE